MREPWRSVEASPRPLHLSAQFVVSLLIVDLCCGDLAKDPFALVVAMLARVHGYTNSLIVKETCM
jgi:hypothetical protein